MVLLWAASSAARSANDLGPMLLGALRFVVGSSSCVLWVTWARVPLRLVVLYGLVLADFGLVLLVPVVNQVGDKLPELGKSATG